MRECGILTGATYNLDDYDFVAYIDDSKGHHSKDPGDPVSFAARVFALPSPELGRLLFHLRSQRADRWHASERRGLFWRDPLPVCRILDLLRQADTGFFLDLRPVADFAAWQADWAILSAAQPTLGRFWKSGVSPYVAGLYRFLTYLRGRLHERVLVGRLGPKRLLVVVDRGDWHRDLVQPFVPLPVPADGHSDLVDMTAISIGAKNQSGPHVLGLGLIDAEMYVWGKLVFSKTSTGKSVWEPLSNFATGLGPPPRGADFAEPVQTMADEKLPFLMHAYFSYVHHSRSAFYLTEERTLPEHVPGDRFFVGERLPFLDERTMKVLWKTPKPRRHQRRGPGNR